MPGADSRAATPLSCWRFLWLALMLPMLAPAVAARAADRELASSWRAQPIRIDGSDEEWRGRTLPQEKQRLALGLQNDGDALYLCLVTRDRVLSTQIARQGLMVWLDPGPKRPKKHVFGVHFPIDPRLAATRERGGRWPAGGADLNESTQMAIGILGTDDDEPRRVAISETGGIEARALFHGDVLIFELKVPLKGAGLAPYQIPGRPGDALSVEVATPEWRGSLPPSRGPVGFTSATSAPGGRVVVGYPSYDTSYLKKTTLKALVRLAAGP